MTKELSDSWLISGSTEYIILFNFERRFGGGLYD